MIPLHKDDNAESVPILKPGATIKISPAGSSVASAVLNATSDQIVYLVATAAMNLAFSADPTATTSGMYLPANAIVYLLIEKGHKIAAIGTGDVYITLHA